LKILATEPRSIRDALEPRLLEVADHYWELKTLSHLGPHSQAIEHIKTIITLLYEMRTWPESRSALAPWIENKSALLERFDDVTGKLCPYYKSIPELIRAARLNA
jgi:hypothetical protein